MPASLLGYFDAAAQTAPAVDPGLGVICPFCAYPLLNRSRLSISLMDAEAHDRSWFYRAHRDCYDALPDAEIAKYEEAMLRDEARHAR